MIELEVKMNGTHYDILNLLDKRPRSQIELALSLNLARTTVRGRISELRSMGFDIHLDKGNLHKYTLSKDSKPYLEVVTIQAKPNRRNEH